MIIRRLTKKGLLTHKDDLLKLLIDVYTSNFKLTKSQSREIGLEKISLLNNYIENGSAIFFSVLEGGTLIGFLWLYKHNVFGEDRLHINQIVVDYKFRGKGIGKALMKEAEKCAKHLDIKTIDLHVSETNVDALKMYQNMGFKTEKRYLKKIICEDSNVINNYIK